MTQINVLQDNMGNVTDKISEANSKENWSFVQVPFLESRPLNSGSLFPLC